MDTFVQDDISPGSNLLYTVEVLVSGVCIYKIYHLDGGSYCLTNKFHLFFFFFKLLLLSFETVKCSSSSAEETAFIHGQPLTSLHSESGQS